MLVDSFSRVIKKLRISVTDRCNFRCVYCMPSDPHWLPQPEILTFEEIACFARIAVSLGIEAIRLTGGEPTARKMLPDLVRMIAAIPELKDLSLTTNGFFLGRLAGPLWEAGLRRINISLDTLSGEKFRHIARRDAFPQTWAGIREAERVGFSPVKVNMVVIRGVNDDEVIDFARMVRTRPWQVRFIEFMPLDGEGVWDIEKVVTAREILEKISSIGECEPVVQDVAEPARVYRFKDGVGDFGIIASVSEPFCGSCDRIRLTADGKIRTCLFSVRETDVKSLLREGATDAEIAGVIEGCVARKEPGHLINRPGFVKPERAMYSIGG